MPTPDIEFAGALLDALREASRDEPGVTRDAYGAGEETAHAIVREAAERLGLSITRDPAGNLFMTWPGKNPDRPAWIVGSHLDSVPHGGNFDGAAGVIAGLAAISTAIKAGRAFAARYHSGDSGRGEHLVPRFLYRKPRCIRETGC